MSGRSSFPTNGVGEESLDWLDSMLPLVDLPLQDGAEDTAVLSSSSTALRVH
jgi:hypothetical protein